MEWDVKENKGGAIIDALEEIAEQQKRTNQLLEKLVSKEVSAFVTIDAKKVSEVFKKTLQTKASGVY